jgi:hypothetical protein
MLAHTPFPIVNFNVAFLMYCFEHQNNLLDNAISIMRGIFVGQFQ